MTDTSLHLSRVNASINTFGGLPYEDLYLSTIPLVPIMNLYICPLPAQPECLKCAVLRPNATSNMFVRPK